MKVSIAIPIYNAESILWHSYRKLKQLLEGTGKDYEILLRNDASKDESASILKEISQKDNRVRIFSHHPNRGLGYTLRELFKSTHGDIVIYLDIDLSFDMSVLPSFLNQIESTDVILASRYTGLVKDVPMERKIFSRLYYLFTKLLFNINVKDIGSGFVIFKRNVLEQISLSADRFDIHIEIFVKIQQAGFRVNEIPVEYVHNHDAGTFSLLKHGFNALSGTSRLWWKDTLSRIFKHRDIRNGQ